MGNLTRNRSFIGGGAMYFREKGAAAALLNVGNASALTFAINENKLNQRNYQQPGGGNIASTSSITDVTGSVTGLSFSPSTLAVALRSLVNTIAASTVSAEAHTAYVEGFIPLNKVADTSTIVVTGTGGTPTYTIGTDYQVKNNGILIPSGSTIADSTALEIDYDSIEYYNIEGITKASVDYEIYFDGFNDADNGKQVTVKCHTVKFSPSSALALISDDFGELPMEFEVLADTTKDGSSESQYFLVNMAA
jgi:hypothetical protein